MEDATWSGQVGEVAQVGDAEGGGAGVESAGDKDSFCPQTRPLKYPKALLSRCKGAAAEQ